MNSNYDLTLTAKATYKGCEVEFSFDPYNDCTDLDGLKELAANELQSADDYEVEADGMDEELIEIEIVDFDSIPDKWATIESCFEFAEAFAECSYEIEVVEAALECDIQASDIGECYSGEFKSDEDFAMNMAEDTGAIDASANWPMNCIDWEQAAKELMYDYCSENGYYFRNI